MEKIRSGAYYEIEKTQYSEYLDDYTLKLYLINSTERHVFTAVQENSIFTFTLDSTDTAAIAAGEFLYNIVAVDNSTSDITQLEEGYLEVLPNIYSLSTSDFRSHSRICLENIKAVLENRATKDQLSYSIAGRQLVLMSIDDLFKFKNYYEKEVAKEEAQSDNGVKYQNVRVRFK